MHHTSPFPLPAAPDPSAADRIRIAALKCFAAEGVAATSLRLVAEKAGVSIGLVQHHFGAKAGLVVAVDEYVLQTVATAVASQPLPSPPDDSLGELGHRVTSIMTDHPEVVDYTARAFVDGDTIGATIFDGLLSISTTQWDQFDEHGLLQPGIDRTWAALHPLILVIGTALLRKQIDRHLPEPLTTPTQLHLWDDAVAQLLRSGLFANSSSFAGSRRNTNADTHGPPRGSDAL
ncbi:TetR/AcrR family transcriptional regulator [Nocardia sp. XZ_19_385]|uniref:TetR/AcrR family transcriptional regulator n=1 Tax=Nocardia sp. XZ_19_385 TaxID=2769488 RepID=UPI0028152EC2|nr:TetR/AcrR family transcriptional regulator [Nocardia sp. XZ_19_385]